MDKRIEKIKRFREFLLAQMKGLTTEELNKIPAGYNNNIIWNIGSFDLCLAEPLLLKGRATDHC